MKTEIYVVALKEELKLTNGITYSKNTKLYCQRIDNIVYIYGWTRGTGLTVEEARQILSYASVDPAPSPTPKLTKVDVLANSYSIIYQDTSSSYTPKWMKWMKKPKG